MNKTLLMLVLGVIVLAMGLLMINQYSAPPPAKAPAAAQAPAQGDAASQPAGTAQRPTQSLTPPQAAPTPDTRPVAPPPMPGQPAAQAPGQAQGVPPWAAAIPEGAAAPKPATPAESAKPASPQTAQSAPAPTAPAPAATAPQSPAPAKAAATAPKTIRKITVSSVDNGSLVRIVGTDGMQYKTMHLKSPERVVVDLDGVWAVKAPGVPTNKYVSNIRIGKQRDKTRIVIDLRQSPENVRFIRQGGDTLDVRIR